MFGIGTISLSPGQTVLLFGCLILGIFLAVTGLYNLAADRRRRSEARVNRRIEMLARGGDPKAVLAMLKRGIGDLPVWLRRVPGIDWLSRQMAQAGMSVPIERLAAVMIAIALAALLGLSLATRLPAHFLLVPAVLAGVALPVMYVSQRRRKRLARFAEQLPEATDMLVRSLRVGHPLSAACQMVAEEMPDPIGTEFGIVVDEMTYGLDLNQAIVNLGARVDLPDLQYLTVAVSIQYGTGGNLAEVLAGLSKVIRDRFQMYRKIKAVSAEGRMAATFLSIFPFVVVAGIFLLHKSYYLSVADHPLFHILAAVGGALVIMNMVVMRWLTNIKV